MLIITTHVHQLRGCSHMICTLPGLLCSRHPHRTQPLHVSATLLLTWSS